MAQNKIAKPKSTRPTKPRRVSPAKSAKRGLTTAEVILSEPDARLILVVPANTNGLNLRETPGGTILRTLVDGTFVCGREPGEVVQPKIGVPGQWVSVCTLDGLAGFVSAQFVQIHSLPTPPAAPTGTSLPADVLAQRTVITINEATFATQNGRWTVAAGTPVQVVESGDWSAKLGLERQLIQIRTHAFKTGLIPGNLLRAPTQADTRAKVEDGPLSRGLSAWLYGVHDGHDRTLYSGDKQGWALFTSLVGDSAVPDYAEWANAGFGVIARLNNDYGGSGTVPEPARYADFAQRCASWAQQNSSCFIWIIGNEMNNKREWPENGNNPAKEITPERYADCFNRVRRVSKPCSRVRG